MTTCDGLADKKDKTIDRPNGITSKLKNIFIKTGYLQIHFK